MLTEFSTIDYIVFAAYAALILGIGLWVSREKEGVQKNLEDHFLASKSLPWWAIGSSLIAANISAEQFIGMSGSGFALGLAIASYEWMAAFTLIIVGKYFLPIFIEKGIYTIPEFVEKRFSTNLKTILAVFWIALIIAVIMAPLLGGIDQAFQYIQEYTGVVSPGILAVFTLGLFWKKTTNKAAIWGALLSIPIAMFFKVGPKAWAEGSSFQSFFPSIPFMDQMGYTALLTMFLIIVISLLQNKGSDDTKGIPLTKELFKTSPLFNISAFAIMLILVVAYAAFWK